MTAPSKQPKKSSKKKENQQWPPIKLVEKNGRPQYLVDTRKGRKKGVGKRQYFDTRTEAEAHAQIERTKRANEGNSAFDSTGLSKYGWTVAMAIKFALEHLEKGAKSVTVSDAIDRLIASKKAAKRQELYCQELKRRLTRFSDYAGDKHIGLFTAPDIEAFLTSLNVAEGTWNTYRRDMVTLWSYSVKAGLVTTNEAEKTERAHDTDKPPGILLPSQAAALLDASTDVDVKALHTIGLFAGLRGSELMKLHDTDISLDSGYITVNGSTSKTRSRRLVPILPALRAVLEKLELPKGQIAQPNYRRRSTAARRKIGFGVPGKETPEEKAKGVTLIEWPDNALRHSFVSYRLADTNDAAQTALEAGHDQAILFRHYRELVRPAAAKEYFRIGLPPEKAPTKGKGRKKK